MQNRTTQLSVAVVASISALLLLSSCSTAGPTPDDGHGATWSYRGEDGPGHWADLTDAYRACGEGGRQSPVDLPAPQGGPALDLAPTRPVTGRTADNGHTVQFTADDGATTVLDGEALRLVQLHVHAGSEHTVAGEPSAAEFHFVHSDDDDALTVVGVLAEVGDHNPAFDGYVAGATAGAGRSTTVDLDAMLPEERSFATYEGSLTTPPCTEGVRWIVLEQPVVLGADQIAALTAAHHDNARPTQPLGDREVRHTL